jgi:hypothetical protein
MCMYVRAKCVCVHLLGRTCIHSVQKHAQNSSDSNSDDDITPSDSYSDDDITPSDSYSDDDITPSDSNSDDDITLYYQDCLFFFCKNYCKTF